MSIEKMETLTVDVARAELKKIRAQMADMSVRYNTDEVNAMWSRIDQLRAMLGEDTVGLKPSKKSVSKKTTRDWSMTEDFDSAFDDIPSGTYSGKKAKEYKRCHEDHPTLKILNGEFRGGACSSPKPGFDIYVGLDYSMHFYGKHFPWQVAPETHPEHEFQFKITDGRAPSDAVEFKAMITWMVSQLELGKKIHVGCIGGHGRTGLVLAALIAEATGEKDPIQWARDKHCKKAVESTEQVEFLVKHFGAKTAAGSKAGVYSSNNKWQDLPKANYDRDSAVARFNAKYPARVPAPSLGGYTEVPKGKKVLGPEVIKSAPVAGSIW